MRTTRAACTDRTAPPVDGPVPAEAISRGLVPVLCRFGRAERAQTDNEHSALSQVMAKAVGGTALSEQRDEVTDPSVGQLIEFGADDRLGDLEGDVAVALGQPVGGRPDRGVSARLIPIPM